MNLDYIAGFVDGEGSICINKGTNNPLIQIAQANEDVLNVMRDLVGKGRVYKQKCYQPEKHKQVFNWVITGLDAIEFLETISSKLIIKKKEAEVLIQGKHLFQRHKKKLSDETIAGRENLRLLLQKLKKEPALAGPSDQL